MEKACSKCGEVKALSEFRKGHNQCKVCLAAYDKAYREANNERIATRKKAYREANREKAASYLKAWREDNKERTKAYREAYKDKIAAYNKAWREANKEKIKAYREAYYEYDKEEVAAKNKAYYEANREKAFERARKRRATKRQAYVPRCDYWRQVEVEMGEKRRELQEQTGVSYHIDHIYPLSKGGIDHPVNYQILTGKDNISKKDRVDSDCPQQAKLGLISRLVLEEGVDVNEAIKLAEETT